MSYTVNAFYIPKVLDLSVIKAQAAQRAKEDTTTVVHLHRVSENCKGVTHLKYAPGKEVEEVVPQ